MGLNYHYSTVTDAINELRRKGFLLDFNLEENCISCNDEKFKASDFEIIEVYRYEGDSDPADEAVVYGIESRDGRKGILVNGYGSSAGNAANEIIQKLQLHHGL